MKLVKYMNCKSFEFMDFEVEIFDGKRCSRRKFFKKIEAEKPHE